MCNKKQERFTPRRGGYNNNTDMACHFGRNNNRLRFKQTGQEKREDVAESSADVFP